MNTYEYLDNNSITALLALSVVCFAIVAAITNIVANRYKYKMWVLKYEQKKQKQKEQKEEFIEAMQKGETE